MTDFDTFCAILDVAGVTYAVSHKKSRLRHAPLSKLHIITTPDPHSAWATFCDKRLMSWGLAKSMDPLVEVKLRSLGKL